MATAAQVAEFRQANQALSELAQRDLAELWQALDPESSPAGFRDALLEVFPEIVTVYGETAAVLGADWYDMLRGTPPSAASFTAAVAPPVTVEHAQSSARWALGPLFAEDPNPPAALTLLNGAAQRLIAQPGRDSVWNAAARDPVRTGIARIPSGPKTCRFCTMLASRGAVYATRESAGEANKWHNACDCVVTVIRSRDDYPEGHDLDEFKRLYEAGSGVGRDIPTT